MKGRVDRQKTECFHNLLDGGVLVTGGISVVNRISMKCSKPNEIESSTVL